MFRRSDPDGNSANIFQELVRQNGESVSSPKVNPPNPPCKVAAVSNHIQWLLQQNGEKLVLEIPITGKPVYISMLDKSETPTVRLGQGLLAAVS